MELFPDDVLPFGLSTRSPARDARPVPDVTAPTSLATSSRALGHRCSTDLESSRGRGDRRRRDGCQ
jgi:hypothetical protein